MIRPRFLYRFSAAVAIGAASAGLIAFLSDTVVRDLTLIFAGFAALATAAAFAVILLPFQTQETDDAWEDVQWGKFFVALVYASVAVVFLIAMVHSPDSATLVRHLRAAL